MESKSKHLKESALRKSISWFRNARTLIKFPRESERVETRGQEEKTISLGKEVRREQQVKNQEHGNNHKATWHQSKVDDEDEDEEKLRIWIERNVSSRQRWREEMSVLEEGLESERSTPCTELMNDESAAIPPLSVVEYVRIRDTQQAPQSHQKSNQHLLSSTYKSEGSNVFQRISLTDLPDELLDDILQRVRNSSSFQRYRSYLMVCKRLYIIGLPLLYQEIFYSSTTYYSRSQFPHHHHANNPTSNRSHSCSKDLEVLPAEDNHVISSPLQPFYHFAKHIKSFTLAFDWQEWLAVHFVGTAADRIEFFSSVSHLLPCLRNLEFFSLIVTPVYSPESIAAATAIRIKSNISSVIESLPASVTVLNIDITAVDSRQPDEPVPLQPVRNRTSCKNLICTQLKDMTPRLKSLQVRVGHNCTLLHALADEKIARCPRRGRRGVNGMHAASGVVVHNLCPSIDNRYDVESWSGYYRDRASLQWWGCNEGCRKFLSFSASVPAQY